MTGRTDERLKEWRYAVFKRDAHTCQECGAKKRLHAHHVKPWAKFPQLRYEAANGITLCSECHAKQHPEHAELIRRAGLYHTRKRFGARGCTFWEHKPSVKMFACVPYPDELNDRDIGRLVTLSKKIWADTNAIGAPLEPFDVDRTGEVVRLKRRSVGEWLNKMIGLGIIARDGANVYYFNPMYFASSNRLSLNLYLLFRKQLDRVLPDWVKDRFAELKVKQEQEGLLAAS